MAGIAEQLRQAVLQAAIQGKLTEQLPEDGDARDLLAEIQAEKDKLIAEKIIKKERPLEPISDGEIPFDIPENWKWTRLNDIVSALGDGIHGTPQFSDEGECYFVNGNNLSNGKVVIKPDTKRISWQEFEKYKKELNQNTIFVSINGTIGNYAFYDNEPIILGKSACYFNVLSKTDKKYLCNLIKTKFFLSYTTKEATKTTIKNVSLKAMRMLPIPLPPLAEQHRIVARVEELMAKIDELEKVENELNALHKAFPGDMKAALLQAAMQGKLTEQLREDGNVDELLLAIEKERNELIAKKEIKKDDLENLTDIPFDVPESWRWVKLNNIVIKNIKRGKSPTYAPNSHILVFAQKCNTKAGYINMDLALFLDEDKAKKYPNSEYMQDADTVINSTGNGTLGRVGFYKESDNPRHFPVVPDSHVTVVRTSSKLNKKYVMYCLKYFQPYFEKKCTGSTNQTELGVDIVKNLPFPVPPIKEQQRIVEKLDKLLPLCDSLEEKL